MPLFVASVCGTSAQANLSMADLLRLAEIQTETQPDSNTPKSVATNGKTVDMLVRFDDESALNAIVGNGGEVVEQLTAHSAIVRVTTGNAVDVAASAGVKSASLSSLLHKRNLAARTASKVEDVHNGVNLPQAYTGKGVVVGLFDVGLDPNHINFRDADNNRISHLWYYPGNQSTPTEYTTDNINEFSTDSRTDSHATHVLGIISGSFVDANDEEKRDYRGIAPEAEMVASCGTGYDAQLLGATRKIAGYAKEQGKPCVINLSWGSNIGPHDGTDDFTATLDEIAEENNAVICIAGGNERTLPIAFNKTFTNEDAQLRTFLSNNDDGAWKGYESKGQVQVWSEDATPVEVSLEVVSSDDINNPFYTLTLTEQPQYMHVGTSVINKIPDYANVTLISGIEKLSAKYKTSYVGGACGINKINGRYFAEINAELTAKSQSVNPSDPNTHICLHVKGQPGKKVFVYCDGIYNEFFDYGVTEMETFTGAGTNSNLAAGHNTITVGSYVTANVKNSGYPEQEIGSPSYFSSFGETGDGRVQPDICTPGQVIISSKNSYDTSSSYPTQYTYTTAAQKKYNWCSCSGTSQATPHMAGVAALWLSANPNLTFNEVKQIAIETAAEPTVQGLGWGAGRLDAYAGIKKAISMTSIENVFDNINESVMITPNGSNEYEIFVAGHNHFTASLVSTSGTIVKQFISNNGTLTISTADVTPGIYLLTVNAPRAARTLKIAVN